MSRFGNLINRVRGKSHSIQAETKEDRIFWNSLGIYGHQEFSKVSAAVRAGFILANGMGMMPVNLLDESGQQVIDERLNRLLNKRPNDFMTAVELRETITLHAVFTGTGRAWIRRNSRKQPIEIMPLHPLWMANGWVWKDGEYVLAVQIPNEEFAGYFKREDIIEITNPRWDMISGMNTTKSCASVLGLSTRMQDRQANLSKANAPYGIITAKEGTSDGAIKKLKSAWVSQFGTSGIAVVDFDAKFDQLMQSPADQQLLETMKFQVAEVARVYGVHPYFLMQTEGSGAQGAVSDVMLFHQVHGIGPWVGRYEAALGFSLLNGTNYTAEMDESALMRSTPEMRAEIYAKALGAGGNKPWMTENEVRQGKSPFRLAEHKQGDQLAPRKEQEDAGSQV